MLAIPFMTSPKQNKKKNPDFKNTNSSLKYGLRKSQLVCKNSKRKH